MAQPTAVPGFPAGAEKEAPALPAGVSENWWEQAQKQLQDSEYHASKAPSGDLQAPNRAQSLRFWFDDSGALTVPRDATSQETAVWQWGLALKQYGWQGGESVTVAPAAPQADKNTITYQRSPLLREWYINEPAGLKSWFEIKSAPPGEGTSLRLELAVRGNTSASMGTGDKAQTVDFRTESGASVIQYSGLKAWDATGRALTCTLSLNGDKTVVLNVDAAGAVFPVTIDPLASSSVWTAESDQASANFGTSVASAGDVNGDGYSDVIVGAPFYDNGQSNEGRAYVFLGSVTGLGASVAWTAESDQNGAEFGQSVASAGDINGDGFSDVIVGARFYDNGQSNEGRVYAYLGSATGLTSSPAWTSESDQDDAYFGHSVASAGDVNGDGYSDVIVGAYGFDNVQLNEGRAYVYLGSATGLTTGSAWTAESDQTGAAFGNSVAAAGDINGDGFSDVIVGARFYDNGNSNEGRAYAYLGSATGLSSGAAWTAESDQDGAQFGYSVASAGDVNGDGHSDVIVGAVFYSNGQSSEGRAYVYLGSTSGPATSADWTAESDQADAYFGFSVASAGDVNGDGYSDVIVGATNYDNGQSNEGRAYAYLGSASGLATTVTWTVESDQTNANLGVSVASAGDVNGDGYSDAIVGAPLYANGEITEGRASTYLGSASGLGLSYGWTDESNQATTFYGYSVASAGDVNGDGYSDVIVGASRYDNGESDEGGAFVYMGSATGLATSAAWTVESGQTNAYFGHSVASAGDVNGDGFSDVIIGAPLYDNGQGNEGRAYVYLGSASGLSTIAGWTAESDQIGAQYGSSVASAGDVNGDGFSDIIVGARLFDNGGSDKGRAYVYLGAAFGLATSTAWMGESEQDEANFGTSVASAGDVNGDGYSDIIVGAKFYDNGQSNEGRAYLFLGSASGPATSEDWSAESDQDNAYFGEIVASAGDVNGDGYSDVMVGAPLYDNGQSDEGRAYVFLGSATGLASTAAWTAEGDQDGAQLGNSVASAGDVNGDGYSEVIVGAYAFDNGESNEGIAIVYLGSATGLTTSSAWTAEIDQVGAGFGFNVASAGDVNGDGYSDVIVGAPYFDGGQIDEGRACVYFGNGEAGGGLSLIPRQRRGNNTAPLSHLGLSNNPAGIRLAAIGRTPYGRAKVKLQWEIKPAGTPFNGTGLGQSASWLDSGTAGVSINQLIGGQAPSTRYHWRVRLLYNPSLALPQQASRWLTLDGKTAERTTFRTGISVPVGLAGFSVE